jgi:hypothetical protein
MWRECKKEKKKDVKKKKKQRFFLLKKNARTRMARDLHLSRGATGRRKAKGRFMIHAKDYKLKETCYKKKLTIIIIIMKKRFRV